MLPERPNLKAYANLLNEFADFKDSLARAEYAYDKAVAEGLRRALNNKAKTADLPCVKVLGNNDIEGQHLEGLKNEVLRLKALVNRKQGELHVWQAHKDLYTTDSYHTVRGSVQKLAENGEE